MATQNPSAFIRQERIMVSSAIPSAVLNLASLPSRPKPARSSGPVEHLYTNHFACRFGDHLPLYQYDVTIEEVSQRSKDWFETKGRGRCASTMQLLISTNRFPAGVILWYDEQKCLYSTSLLPSPQCITSADGQCRVNIKSLANQWSTNDITEYIGGQATTYPFDAVRILETLLKKSLQDRVRVVHDTCYFTNDPPKALAPGFEERPGFSQALNLGSGGVTLNVQTKLTTFYKEMSLLDFIYLQIGSKRMPNGSEFKRLTHMLKDCLVVTQQSNFKQAYMIDRFDTRTPAHIKIESGDNLIEFYNTAKGIKLALTDYPCVQVYLPNEHDRPCHLPLEVCRIKAWQVYDKPLAKANEAQQPKKSILKPGERYEAIMNVVGKCDYQSASNQLCRAVGFQIADREMLKVDGHVLNKPVIQTGPNSTANVNIGRIPLHGHLFTPRPISALAITYFGPQTSQNQAVVDQFIPALLTVLKGYHVDVRHQQHYCAPTEDQINRYFKTMSEKGCQLVVCIMHAENDNETTQLKAQIKECGTIRYGVMTQCALLSKIRAQKSPTSYCENLIRKINYKNAGINTKVNLNIALKDKKSATDSFMFFGADVIHPTNVTRQHPSIAAVVGSGDSLCSTTAARVCRQYPKQGKCSIETILGLTDMVEQLLDYNRQANKVLPTKIVFYRDGVDNGQFGKVIAHEIGSIRAAFDRVYGAKPKHPLLTFIVVKKRHNTRFFAYDEGRDQTSNMSIGTVIDTKIVHAYQHDFYLNSHNAFQGVNKPSLYHVLLDEIGFTADELQAMTYHLCYTDPRSSAAEAIPSVVHHADIAALKARDLFYDDDSSSTSSGGGRSRPIKNPTLDDVEFEMLQVHANLTNRAVLG